MSNIRNKVKEALMDKGYPEMEAYDIMKVLGCMYYIVPPPDPSVYTTGGSYLRYYEHWSKMEEENCKEALVIIDYMIPVWNKYDNWQYRDYYEHKTV